MAIFPLSNRALIDSMKMAAKRYILISEAIKMAKPSPFAIYSTIIPSYSGLQSNPTNQQLAQFSTRIKRN
jgi:hypothetical protein